MSTSKLAPSVIKSAAPSPDREWSVFVFNLIAPFYRRIDFLHSTHYLNAIALVDREVKIRGKTILDVGTGTGDWGAMFNLYQPKEVQGVDFAHRMVETAKIKHPEIHFSFGNAQHLAGFGDNSFDVVTASFVVHGAKKTARNNMLREMKRVTRKYIVLHDFLGPTPPFIRFLELLERSDYKDFKKNIFNELEEHFTQIQKFNIKKGSGIYIAHKK